MHKHDKRLAALEASRAQAIRVTHQDEQEYRQWLDRFQRRLKDVGSRCIEAPTRAQNSPMECLAWLMYRTGEPGRTAGVEAIIAIAGLVKQPQRSREDAYNAIQIAAERWGIAWDRLGTTL
jgi:hypothetical protein